MLHFAYSGLLLLNRLVNTNEELKIFSKLLLFDDVVSTSVVAIVDACIWLKAWHLSWSAA